MKIHLRCVATLAAALLVAAPARAQAPAAPLPLQAATFDKIFDFDRALGDRVQLKVLLVYDGAGGRDAAAALQKAFTAAAIPAEPVALQAAAGRFQETTVAYLLPGTATPELLQAAAAARALTIAGDAALAEQGKVSVGVAMRGDKVDIIVNLDRVAEEGHDFTAQLLKFARVVRGGVVVSAGAGASPAGPGIEEPEPVLINITRPAYPALAQRMRLQGDVVMRLAIDATGKVTNVELVKGLGRGGVDEVAIAAARTARFRPATRNGFGVPSTYLLVMPFRL